ncbi:DUF2256 domain-containing protein [uncultured Friedmanniella sp.]|uniref:DUF2256 domain-containing protein n=1 Tax=uncultured Friedmanniella sp. TaxID=335381 RepID=UPI0035CC7E60
MPPPPKFCRSCGRRITWRKKWERDWDEVRYCSAGCRARGVSTTDRRIEAEIRRLVRVVGSVTDQQVTEALAALGLPDDLEPVRRAARRLEVAGEVELVQRGRVVDPSTARGPVTIRRQRAG